jgi:hypothetical protein
MSPQSRAGPPAGAVRSSEELPPSLDFSSVLLAPEKRAAGRLGGADLAATNGNLL